MDVQCAELTRQTSQDSCFRLVGSHQLINSILKGVIVIVGCMPSFPALLTLHFTGIAKYDYLSPFNILGTEMFNNIPNWSAWTSVNI